ncbi:MAG: exo-alpha-sialidase, partial [Phycisphaerales bacterium]|nr:exo-alpha-sialidase [Phycisphaerales bacterium]
MKDLALMLSLAAVLLTAVAAGPIAPPTSTDAKHNDPPGDPSIHHEVADDAPRAYVPRTDLPRAPLIAPGAPGAGVQVNVDAFGGNIPGDAANEPSIAVDPAAPSRIVIGWRQFDTVQSNFRQAGVAYSHDSGATWTFLGVIEPGVFRSDPVLDVDANGTFYYCSLRSDFACTMFRSVDGGQTWDNGTFAFGGDKQWFSIDRTPEVTRDNQYLFWNP